MSIKNVLVSFIGENKTSIYYNTCTKLRYFVLHVQNIRIFQCSPSNCFWLFISIFSMVWNEGSSLINIVHCMVLIIYSVNFFMLCVNYVIGKNSFKYYFTPSKIISNKNASDCDIISFLETFCNT